MSKTYWLIAFSVLAAMTVGGCSSDEDETVPTDEVEEDNLDEQHYAEVCGRLFEQDVDGVYTFTDGICLDVSTPGIYTACADSTTAGENFFYSRCVPEGEESRVVATPSGATYSFGEYGSVSLIISPNDQELSARILFRLADKPEIEELQFIPSNLWPNNDVRSPFNVGYVVREISTKTMWLCVRKCEGSNLGLLINFDYGWKFGGLRSRDSIYTNCASETIWTCFCALKRENESYFVSLCAYFHSLCERGKCAKDAYIPFELIYGRDTGKIRWVQVGNWNATKRKVYASKLQNALVGINILRYQLIIPGDSVFYHSAGRTFTFGDDKRYVKLFPQF
jgi:hypothetical protein